MIVISRMCFILGIIVIGYALFYVCNSNLKGRIERGSARNGCDRYLFRIDGYTTCGKDSWFYALEVTDSVCLA